MKKTPPISARAKRRESLWGTSVEGIAGCNPRGSERKQRLIAEGESKRKGPMRKVGRGGIWKADRYGTKNGGGGTRGPASKNRRNDPDKKKKKKAGRIIQPPIQSQKVKKESKLGWDGVERREGTKLGIKNPVACLLTKRSRGEKGNQVQKKR